jgi:uncharacterized membrane protein YfhO
VDGRPAVVGRANVSLIGVELPAGGKRVELTFENGPYRTGRTVTWAAVLGALVLWGAGLLVARRHAARA